MAKRKTDEYIFADSYLGVHASRLIPRNDLLRIAGSRNLEGAAQILRDYDYEETKELTEGDVDGFLRREEEALKNSVLGIIPDPTELEFQFYPADFRNAAVIIKTEKMGKPLSEESLSGAGSIPASRLLEDIRDQKYSDLPEELRSGAVKAEDTFAKGRDPQVIDLILDQALAKAMVRNAEESGEDFLIEVVRRRIDRINLGTFVRLRELGRDWTSLRDVFLEGGNVSLELLVSVYGEPYARVGERMDSYGFSRAFSEGGKTLKETGSVAFLERLLDDAVMDYVKQVKYDSFGVNVIEGYLYAKQSELRNLRIALTGCQLGFAAEEMEERLRETYE